MNIEILINDIDARVKERFRYTMDGRRDRWRSHAKEFNADEEYTIYDDCDGLASTIIDLLSRSGIPKSLLFRAIVSSPEDNGVRGDHMVGMVLDKGRDYWFVGDTYGPPEKIARGRHTIRQVSSISDGVNWRNWEK